MRKSRATEGQVDPLPGRRFVKPNCQEGDLREFAAGAKMYGLYRTRGMAMATLYKWKVKYGGKVRTHF